MDVAASEFFLPGSGDYDLDFKTEDNDGSAVVWHSGPPPSVNTLQRHAESPAARPSTGPF